MTTKSIKHTVRPHVQPKGLHAGEINPGWAQVYLDQSYVPARLPEGPVLFIAGTAIIRKANGVISLLNEGDTVSKGDVVMTSPDGIVQIQTGLAAPGALAVPSNVLGDGGELDAVAAGLAVARLNETVGPQTFSHAMAVRALPLAAPIGVAQAINHAPIYSDNGNPNFDPNTGNYNLTIPEDTTVSGRVAATDPDGDVLSYFIAANPGNGTVAVNPDGTWTYTPAANFNGTDSFAVLASDGRGGQTTSIVTIGVTPVNDPPETQNITANGAEDPVTPVPVLFSGTDVDNAVTGFHVLTLPAATEGVLYKDLAMTQPVLAGDILSGPAYFMPAPNWNGTTTLTYAAIDALNAEDTTPATATIIIAPVNDPPVVTLPTVPTNNGQVTTPEDTPYLFAGTGNTISLSDPDNTTATVTLNVGNGVLNVGTLPTLTLTNNGTPTVTLSGPIADINAVLNGLQYVPAPNWNGNDLLTVTSTDPLGGTATGTKPIIVTPVNDPPETQNTTANGLEDPVTPVPVIFSGTDIDNAVTGFHVLTLPAATEGVLYKDVAMTQLVLAGDILSGPAYFMPVLNWNGTTALTYAAIDALNAEDATPATATIIIAPVNDPPVVTLPTVPVNNVITPEDTPYIFTGPGKAISLSDPDNTTATVTLNVPNGVLDVGTLPTLTVTNNGSPTVTVSGPIADINTVLDGLKYTPTPDWNGPTQLTVTSTDPLGAVTTAIKPITVTPVTDSMPDFSVTLEDTPLVNVNLIQNDGFSTTPLSKVVIWTLQDTSPTHSASHFIDYGTVTQDPITGAVLSYTGGIPVYDSADHYAGQIISVSRVPQGLNEVLTFIPAPNYNNADPSGNPLIDPATGRPISLVVNYQVAPDYGSGQITAGAETSTWSIVVKMVNDPPVYQQTSLSPNFSATPNATGGPVTYEYNQQVMEDSNPTANASNTGQVHAVDVEDGSLTSGYRLLLPNGSLATSGTTTHGTIIVNNDGTWQYTPSANFNGLDSFQVQVSDSNGSAVNTTVKLGVTSVNDTPVFSNLTYTSTTPEDTQATGVVQATDIDITLGDLSQWLVYSLGSTAGMQPASVVGVTQDGHWTYQPAPNFFGTESFQIIVNDNSGAGNATAITTVTVSVSPVNDPPVFITTPTDPLTPGFNTGTLNYNYSVPGNTAVITDKVSAFDVDGDTVTFSLVMAPNVPGALTQPVVTVNPDGTWSYTPAVMPAGNPTPFYVGGDSFAIRANDGHGGTATTTIQLDLTNPAAIPVVASPIGLMSNAAVTNAQHANALSLHDVFGPSGSDLSLDGLLNHSLGSLPTIAPPPAATAPTAGPVVGTASSALSFAGPLDHVPSLGAILQPYEQTASANHHGGGA